MELWWTERQTPSFGITFKVKQVLEHIKNEFAELEVFDTEEFGKVLALDGAVQLTERDEFFYAETLAHTTVAYALRLLPNPPLKILIVGGGDLTIARELLKYPPEVVADIHVIDINPAVTEVAKQYFLEDYGNELIKDDRLLVSHEDAIEYVKGQAWPSSWNIGTPTEPRPRDYYNAAIIDSTDPVGPAKGLFGKQFIQDLMGCSEGPIVAQTCSPFFHPQVLQEMIQIARELEFPVIQPLVGFVPSYPAIWSYLVMSDWKPNHLPQQLPLHLKYFSKAVFGALHATPSFIKEVRDEQ